MEGQIMQNSKVGNIIRTLRQECNMTQKQLADKMNINDKTVSKWERGLGCPAKQRFHAAAKS
jgi:transcriptional regulator with XRE-family HTH domain